MTKLTQETSNKIANLSFVCACLVVLLHVFPNVPVGGPLWWFDKIIACGVGRIAVPFFFVVSGFMLARRCEENGWFFIAVRKRIKSLFVPFVLWNLVWILWLCRGDFSSGLHQLQGMIDPFRQPPLGPLWYLRSLMIFVVVTPFLYWLIQHYMKIVLGVSFILYALLFIPGNNAVSVMTSTLHLEGLFYYMVGLSIAVRNHKIDGLLLWLLVVMSVVVTILRIVCLRNGIYAYYPLRAVVIPGFLLLSWKLVPSVRWPSVVTASSFPIYLMHMLALVFFSKITGKCDSCEKYAILAGGGGG